MSQPDITQIPPRAAKYYQTHNRPAHSNDITEPLIRSQRLYRRRRQYTPFVGGMVIILGILVFWQWMLFPFITSIENQWHAGDARVTSLVYDFHHGGESTLIGMDYHGQITIIELVGEKATMYRGANFIGNDRLSRVVSLSVQDVNGDGKPDLVITVVGMSSETVLFNTGSAFSWTSK